MSLDAVVGGDDESDVLSELMIENSIIRLDRDHETERTCVFIEHLIRSKRSAGLLFLCGEGKHGVPQFVRRLCSDGEREFQEFSTLKTPPVWRTDSEVAMGGKRPLRPEYLVNALNEHANKGFEGLPRREYRTLIEAYEATNPEAEEPHVFVFGVRIDQRHFERKQALQKILDEFQAFRSALDEQKSIKKVTFVFCAFVADHIDGLVNVAEDSEEYEAAKRVFKKYDFKGGYSSTINFHNPLSTWAISSWDSITLDDVDYLFNDLEQQVRQPDRPHLQVMQGDVTAFMVGQEQGVHLYDVRERMMTAYRKARSNGE